MDLLVIPNAKRLPSRTTGEVADYLTAIAPDGRELPIAVDGDNVNVLRALEGYGVPEPAPPGLETVRFPEESALLEARRNGRG